MRPATRSKPLAIKQNVLDPVLASGAKDSLSVPGCLKLGTKSASVYVEKLYPQKPIVKPTSRRIRTGRGGCGGDVIRLPMQALLELTRSLVFNRRVLETNMNCSHWTPTLYGDVRDESPLSRSVAASERNPQ